MFTSAELLEELAEVLARKKIATRLEARHSSAAQVLDAYRALAEVVGAAAIARTAPDPDDDALLGCALAANADLIVSGDLGLRNLKSFQRIPIVSPVAAVSAVLEQVNGGVP